MLNGAGEVACASAANLFWVEEGRLHTPALDCGVLAGVMRGRVMAAASRRGLEVVEARAEPRALADAQAVFLTNSLIGVRAAASLDGLALATAELIEALRRDVG
jgi:branched-subunit amino acid aminotransferase/4-amino-4-deoxychorismate lyase